MKRRVRIAVRLALVATVLVGGYAYALSPDPLPPCATEDSTNCYWDADTQGNGQGRSFYDIDGITHYSD